jgi:GT2 family glycosyltransferase
MSDYASIVILTLNAPKRLLDDISKQTYRNLEVIIADKPGIVNAMNIALSQAKGNIFIRIDDDVSLPMTWLEELIKPFQDKNVAGATGPTFVPYFMRENRDSINALSEPNWFLRWMFDNNLYAPAKIYKCGAVSYGSNFYEYIDCLGDYQIDHLEGTNWAMRTDLIRKVGGFDLKFDGVAEWFDDDVVFKVKKLGYKLVYNPRAYLWHLLDKGKHFEDRFEGFGRIKNWLRFHLRHSRFHYKKVVWLLLMIAYFTKRKICK